MDSNSASVVGKKRSANTISDSSATSSAPELPVNALTKAQSKETSEEETDKADLRLEKKEARSRSSISLLRSTLNDNEDGKLQLAGLVNLMTDYKRKIVSLEKKCGGQKEKLKKLQQKYSDKKQLELDSEAKDIMEKFGGDCTTTRAKLNRVMQSLQWDSTRRIENMRRTNELKEQRKAKNPIWRDLAFLLNKAAKTRDLTKKKNGAVIVTPKIISKSDTANGNDSSDEVEERAEETTLIGQSQQGPEFIAGSSDARQGSQSEQGAARKKSRPNKN